MKHQEEDAVLLHTLTAMFHWASRRDSQSPRNQPINTTKQPDTRAAAGTERQATAARKKEHVEKTNTDAETISKWSKEGAIETQRWQIQRSPEREWKAQMGRDPSTWKHGGQQKQRSWSYTVDMSTRAQEELTTTTVSESCWTREGKRRFWGENTSMSEW